MCVCVHVFHCIIAENNPMAGERSQIINSVLNVKIFITFDPDISCCNDGKHKQEHYEEKSFQVISGYSLDTKQNGTE